MRVCLILAAATAAFAASPQLEQARDRQDRAAIQKMLPALNLSAQKQFSNALAHYNLAIAEAYLAEVALELRDRAGAAAAAETGIQAARRAVELAPKNAEYHRVLGALCGLIIPANVLAGIKYGKCALESLNKAIELDAKSADAWTSRGIGNYYLPSQFGGGAGKAIADLQRATKLNPKSAEAWLWLGLALRKENRNGEARAALSRAVELSPQRLWAKQQLEKTPAQ